MRKFIYLISIISLIFVTSCTKDIEEVNPDYFGYWENIDGSGIRQLNINQVNSTYFNLEGIKTISVTGKARVKKNEKKLRIGFKGFKIDQKPYQSGNGFFTMVIDGVTYERYE